MDPLAALTARITADLAQVVQIADSSEPFDYLQTLLDEAREEYHCRLKKEKAAAEPTVEHTYDTLEFTPVSINSPRPARDQPETMEGVTTEAQDQENQSHTAELEGFDAETQKNILQASTMVVMALSRKTDLIYVNVDGTINLFWQTTNPFSIKIARLLSSQSLLPGTIASVMLWLSWLQFPSRNIREAGTWLQDLTLAIEFVGLFFWWLVTGAKVYFMWPKVWDFVVKGREADREGCKRPANGCWPSEPFWLPFLFLALVLNTINWFFRAARGSGHIANADEVFHTIYGPVESSAYMGVLLTCRAYYLVYESRAARKLFRSLGKIIPATSGVLTVGAMSFLVHYMFLRAAGDDVNGWGSHEDEANQMWNLYVLFTTANHPDALMTMYHDKGWTGIILFSYMVLNVIFLLNILLAVITDTYADEASDANQADAKLRKMALSHAFELVCSDNESRKSVGRRSTVKPSTTRILILTIGKFFSSSNRALQTLDAANTQFHKCAAVDASNKHPDTIWANVLFALCKDASSDDGLSRSEWHRLIAFMQVPLKMKSILDPAVRFKEDHRYLSEQLNLVADHDDVRRAALQSQLNDLETFASPYHWAARLPWLHYMISSWSYPATTTDLNMPSTITYHNCFALGLIILFGIQIGTSESGAIEVFTACFVTVDLLIVVLAHLQRREWRPPPYNGAMAEDCTKERPVIRLPSVMWSQLLISTHQWSGVWSFSSATGPIMTAAVVIFSWASVGCYYTGESATDAYDAKKPPICGQWADHPYQLSAIACVSMAFRLCTATMRADKSHRVVQKLKHALCLAWPMIVLFTSIYTFFIGIGMSLFAGQLTQVVEDGGPGDWSTAPWNETAFYSEVARGNYYYDLSFDNFGKAVILLLQQTIMNNWHVPVDGHQSVTGTSLVRVFFLAFNFLVSILLMNVFVGYLITIFSELSDDERKKIAGEFRPMAALLTHMEHSLQKSISAFSGQSYSRFWEVNEVEGLWNDPGQLVEDEKLMLPCSVQLAGDPGNASFLSILTSCGIPLFVRGEEGTIMYVSIPFRQMHREEMHNLIAETTADVFPEWESLFVQCHHQVHEFCDQASSFRAAQSNFIRTFIDAAGATAAVDRIIDAVATVTVDTIIDAGETVAVHTSNAARRATVTPVVTLAADSTGVDMRGLSRASTADAANASNADDASNAPEMTTHALHNEPVVEMGIPARRWRLHCDKYEEDSTVFWLTLFDDSKTAAMASICASSGSSCMSKHTNPIREGSPSKVNIDNSSLARDEQMRVVSV